MTAQCPKSKFFLLTGHMLPALQRLGLKGGNDLQILKTLIFFQSRMALDFLPSTYRLTTPIITRREEDKK